MSQNLSQLDELLATDPPTPVELQKLLAQTLSKVLHTQVRTLDSSIVIQVSRNERIKIKILNDLLLHETQFSITCVLSFESLIEVTDRLTGEDLVWMPGVSKAPVTKDYLIGRENNEPVDRRWVETMLIPFARHIRDWFHDNFCEHLVNEETYQRLVSVEN